MEKETRRRNSGSNGLEKEMKVNGSGSFWEDKKNIKRGMLGIVLLVILVCLCMSTIQLAKYTMGKQVKEKDLGAYLLVEKMFGKQVKQPTTEEYKLTIGFLGDINIPKSLSSGCYSSGKYNFSNIFKDIKEDVSKYDITIAGLNTPVTGSEAKSKKSYDSPKEILTDIKETGIDVLTTATNNILDKKEQGIIATIKNIKESGLEQTGITIKGEEIKPYIIEKNNIKIAVMSYTSISNVKLTSSNKDLINVLEKEKVLKDVKFAKEKGAEYIVAYLSSGENLQERTDSQRKTDAQLLIDNGIDVVVGSYGGIIQSGYEEIIAKDGEESQRHIYEIYSTGDFVGSQLSDNADVSTLSSITITKKVRKDKEGAIFDTKTNMQVEERIPLVTISNAVKTKYRILNADKEIKNYKEEGNNNITEVEYKYLMKMGEWYNNIIK